MKQLILLFLVAAFLVACNEELQSELVYMNDFENNLTEEVKGASLHTFNGSIMSGNYNKGGFTVHLEGLNAHEYVMISFDLYIHDTWDGNIRGVGGPDFWMLQVDEWEDLSLISQKLTFRTTFSNTNCNILYCLRQSYPANFPFSNDPGTGRVDLLSGLCDPSDPNKITSLYRIEKVFPHSGQSLAVKFSDQLRQVNVSDEACDESWSLDNLEIAILNTD